MPNWKKYEEIPKDIVAKMKWRCQMVHDDRVIKFECEELEPQTGGACLFVNIIMDTSHVVEHIRLETEFTYLEEAFVGGAYAWFGRKISLEET
jgi:hypothetical protein